jgi:hypothetical protein
MADTPAKPDQPEQQASTPPPGDVVLRVDDMPYVEALIVGSVTIDTLGVAVPADQVDDIMAAASAAQIRLEEVAD